MIRLLTRVSWIWKLRLRKKAFFLNGNMLFRILLVFICAEKFVINRKAIQLWTFDLYVKIFLVNFCSD